MRTTGHGLAAGIGKLGAFIGVFLVPQLQKNIGLRGMLVVAGGAAILGYLLTMVLPEPARRTLEEVSGEDQGHDLLLQTTPRFRSDRGDTTRRAEDRPRPDTHAPALNGDRSPQIGTETPYSVRQRQVGT
jgi:hypothetical protein